MKKIENNLLKFPINLIIKLILWSVLILFGIDIILFFFFSKSRDHLPALSETGIYPPSRYIFTFICTVVGVLISILSIILYLVNSNHPQISKRSFYFIKFKLFNILNHLILFIAGLGLLGLGVVPIIEPNEDDFINFFQKDKTSIIIHLSCTGIFFSFSLIHIILSHLFYNKHYQIEKNIKGQKIIKKRFFYLVAIFSIIGFTIIYSIFTQFVCGKVNIQGETLFTPIESVTCLPQKLQKLFIGAIIQYLIIGFLSLYIGSYSFELSDSFGILQKHFK